jgi:hypothetical protein
MTLFFWICSSHLTCATHAWVWKAGFKPVGEWPSNAFDSSETWRFLCRVAPFLESEMDNPFSNSTWAKRTCISVEKFQNWSVHVLYIPLSTLHKASKQRLLPVAPESVVHPPNLTSLVPHNRYKALTLSNVEKLRSERGHETYRTTVMHEWRSLKCKKFNFLRMRTFDFHFF